MPLLSFDKLASKTTLPQKVIATINNSYEFTERKISILRKLIRQKLKENQHKNGFCIVAVGSYGRYEASEESDLDVYVIYNKAVPQSFIAEINIIISDAAVKSDVKFSNSFDPISLNKMLKNIGGEDDTNSSITNRILFLLESECLYNQSFFNRAYDKILKKYLKDVSSNKVPRFLLNDIIRYYRTICVDYEFKVSELGKEWAIRNIKLRFSRKALYFGGIIVLLNSLNRSEPCHDYVIKNLRKPFIEKISHILIEQERTNKHKKIIRQYSHFLQEIGKKEIRTHLKKLKKADKERDEVFRKLADNAREFSNFLRDLLNKGTWGNKNYLDFLVF